MKQNIENLASTMSVPEMRHFIVVQLSRQKSEIFIMN